MYKIYLMRFDGLDAMAVSKSEKNREKIAARMKHYVEANAEKILERCRAYKAASKDKTLEQRKD